jgi:hypothetical protein
MENSSPTKRLLLKLKILAGLAGTATMPTKRPLRRLRLTRQGPCR